jgi:hypothetical protein
MSFALFEDGERLTRSFPTERDVWAAAERAGLVDIGSDGERRLDDHLEIRHCEPTPDEAADPGFARRFRYWTRTGSRPSSSKAASWRAVGLE